MVLELTYFESLGYFKIYISVVSSYRNHYFSKSPVNYLIVCKYEITCIKCPSQIAAFGQEARTALGRVSAHPPSVLCRSLKK